MTSHRLAPTESWHARVTATRVGDSDATSGGAKASGTALEHRHVHGCSPHFLEAAATQRNGARTSRCNAVQDHRHVHGCSPHFLEAAATQRNGARTSQYLVSTEPWHASDLAPSGGGSGASSSGAKASNRSAASRQPDGPVAMVHQHIHVSTPSSAKARRRERVHDPEPTPSGDHSTAQDDGAPTPPSSAPTRPVVTFIDAFCGSPSAAPTLLRGFGPSMTGARLVPAYAFDNSAAAVEQYESRFGVPAICCDGWAALSAPAVAASGADGLVGGSPCCLASFAHELAAHEHGRDPPLTDALQPPNHLYFAQGDAVARAGLKFALLEQSPGALLKHDGALQRRLTEQLRARNYSVFEWFVDDCAIASDMPGAPKPPVGGHRTRLFTFLVAPDVAAVCGDCPHPADALVPGILIEHADDRLPDDKVPTSAWRSAHSFDANARPAIEPAHAPRCLGALTDDLGRRAFVFDLHGVLRAQTIHGEPPGGGTGIYRTPSGRFRTLTDMETARFALGWPASFAEHLPPSAASRPAFVNAWAARSAHAVLGTVSEYLAPFFNARDTPPLAKSSLVRATLARLLWQPRRAFRRWCFVCAGPLLLDVRKHQFGHVLVLLCRPAPQVLVAVRAGCLPSASSHSAARDAAVAWASRFCAHNLLRCTPEITLAADLSDGEIPAFLSCRVLAAAIPRERLTARLSWVPLRDLDGASRLAANLANHRLDALGPRSATFRRIDLDAGGVGPARLLAAPALSNADDAAWLAHLEAAHKAEDELRRELQSSGDEYLMSWAPRVGSGPAHDEVPLHLRGATSLPLPEAAVLPFSDLRETPVTSVLPPRRQPSTSFRPRRIEDIICPLGLQLIDDWARGLAKALAVAFASPPGSPIHFRKRLVLGEAYTFPLARGVVWDLRSRDADGAFCPLATGEPPHSHLNRDFLQTQLADWPDQEMVGFLLHGIQFKADVGMDSVLLPHLLSLAAGLHRVDRDLQKLANIGYYEVAASLPFWPCRCAPSGSVERKLEPERPRRIEDQGAPRVHLYSTAPGSVPGGQLRLRGTRVLSLNESIGIRDHLADGSRKWVPEKKPRMPDHMRNVVILRSIADPLGQVVLAATDDLANMFNQFALANGELWKVLTAWRSWSADGKLAFLVAVSLGFGIAAASNFAQRFGDALVALVRKEMCELESRCSLEPAEVDWLQRRRQLLGADQARLFAVDIYTDDPLLLAVGPKRLVRLIRAWRKVTHAAGLRMAIAAKRQCGASVTCYGLSLFTAVSVCAIPPAKRLRAVETINGALAGSITQAEASALRGLLNHLLPFAGMRRDAVRGLFTHFGPNNPAALAESKRPDMLREWLRRLSTSSGVHCASALTPEEARPDLLPSAFLFTDAALAGTPTPGIGGFLHGFWFHVPVPAWAVAGPEKSRSTSWTAHSSARTPLMLFVYDLLSRDPIFQQWCVAGLWVGHTFGGGNPGADFASRGYFDRLRALCSQLGVRSTRVEPPQRALDVFHEILDRHRAFVSCHAAALANAQPFGLRGDGPAARTNFNEICARLRPSPVREGAPASSSDALSPHLSTCRRTLRCATKRTNFVTMTVMPKRARANPATVAAATLPAPARSSFTSAPTPSHSPQPWRLSLDIGNAHVLDALRARVADVVRESGARSTSKTDASHWRFWEAYCAFVQTCPIRSDRLANNGSDAVGFEREVTLLCGFFIWRYDSMLPRSASAPAAKPQSAFNSVLAVRRVHRIHHDIEMVASKRMGRVLKGLLRAFVREHGAEALQPQRKEPVSPQLLRDLLALDEDWQDPALFNFRAMMCTMMQGGFRKAEMSLPDDAVFSRDRVARSALSWYIGGRHFAQLTADLRALLKPGDAAVITCPPSKADPFGLVYGSRPVYLPYEPALPFSAARHLADLELRFPCSARASTPLFTTDGARVPFRHSSADATLKRLLSRLLPDDLVQRYSMHSFRIGLASALLAAGATRDQIHALCRWAPGSNADLLYARPNPDFSMNWISRAAAASLSSTTAANLPRIDRDHVAAALMAAPLQLTE